jgi:hypothetical protein
MFFSRGNMITNIDKEPEVPTSLMMFILFTVLSCGIYPLIWLTKNISYFNSVVSGRGVQFKDIVIIGALWSWSSVIQGVTPEEDNGLIIQGLVIMALNIALLVYHYIFITNPFISGLDKNLLEHHRVDLRPNKFWAFIFAYFYIAALINKIDELKERQLKIDANKSEAK